MADSEYSGSHLQKELSCRKHLIDSFHHQTKLFKGVVLGAK